MLFAQKMVRFNLCLEVVRFLRTLSSTSFFFFFFLPLDVIKLLIKAKKLNRVIEKILDNSSQKYKKEMWGFESNRSSAPPITTKVNQMLIKLI